MSLRILIVSQFYPPVRGGQEQHVRNLCRALLGRGHHVSVATLEPTAAAARALFTAADLAVYPIYAGRNALPDNAGLKNLQGWGERVGSRPGVQKGMKLEV